MNDKPRTTTNWRAVYLLTVISGILAAQVDPDVTPMFFGFMSMGTSGTMSLVGFIPAIVYHYKKAFAPEMLVGGCVLSIVAAILHLIVPFVAGWGKALIVVSQIVYATAYGVFVLIKAIIPKTCTRADIQGVFSRIVLIGTIGSLVGSLPNSFAAKVDITLGWIEINIFSLAAGASIVLSIAIALILICFDKWARDEEADADDSSDSDSFVTALQSLDDESVYETATQGSTSEADDKPKVDVRGVKTCLLIVFCLTFAVGGLETVKQQYAEAEFNWAAEELVRNFSILALVISVVQILVQCVYLLLPSLQRFDAKRACLLALAIQAGSFFVIFPYPGVGDYLQVQRPAVNGSMPSGCNVDILPWCSWTRKTNQWVFMGTIVLANGVAGSLGQSNFNVFASRVIPEQGIFQAGLGVAAGLADFFAPLAIAPLFQSIGPLVVWPLLAAVLVVAFLVLAFFHKKND